MSLIRRVCATLVLAGCGALLAPACVKNDSSLYIKGCVVQDLTTCVATADPTADERFGGLLDAAFAAEYACPLLLGNQLTPQGNQATLRTETARIVVYAADVTILDDAGNQVTRADGSAASYTVPTTGEVDPGGGTSPGFGLTEVVMLDAATANDLGSAACSGNVQQLVVANVIVRGRTLGGDEIESAPFAFPITVCYGCTCSVTPGENCCLPSMTPAANCRPGLDGPTDCALVADCGTGAFTCDQVLMESGCK